MDLVEEVLWMGYARGARNGGLPAGAINLLLQFAASMGCIRASPRTACIAVPCTAVDAARVRRLPWLLGGEGCWRSAGRDLKWEGSSLRAGPRELSHDSLMGR